jgi:hypothetical protein
LAPNSIPTTGATVFLSGSIDAPPASWQTSLSNSLSHLPITILNPHRPDWDSSWKEDISFKPFQDQVNWELDGMERADIIAVYFGAEAKAPITLMELGLFARRGKDKMIVACPEGYWKRGNVQIVCERFNIELVGTVEELTRGVIKKLKKMGIDGEDTSRNDVEGA